MKVSVIIVFLVLLIIGSFLFFYPANNNQESTPAISTLEGVDFYGNSNNIFLDVRTLDEHKTISIPNSLIIPVQELESRVNELKKYGEKVSVARIDMALQNSSYNIRWKHKFNEKDVIYV